MTTDIKPIETHYAGCRFRSRLEARWAVVFETLGLKWEYEPEGYVVDEVPYLPDFWIPEWNTFIEIKPYLDDDFIGMWGLWEQFNRSIGRLIVVFGGPSLHRPYVVRYPLRYQHAFCWSGHWIFSGCDRGYVVGSMDEWTETLDPQGSCNNQPNYDDPYRWDGYGAKMREAIECGIRARFEHGESGGMPFRREWFARR